MSVCSKCGIEILLDNYHTKHECGMCYNDRHNEWQKKNKSKVNVYRMNHYNEYHKSLLHVYVKNGIMKIQSGPIKPTIWEPLKRDRYQLIYREDCNDN